MRAAGQLLPAALLALLAVRAVAWLAAFFPFAGDYAIYTRALATLADGGNPYEPFDIGSGFLYHPGALFLVAPSTIAGPWLWVALAAMAFAGALWLLRTSGQSSGRAATDGETAPLFVPAGMMPDGQPLPREFAPAAFARRLSPLLLLCFAPLWDNLYAGQINTFVLLALVLAVVCARRGAQVPAGMALAVAIVLKMSPALLLLWFAAQRQWRALATAIAGVAVITALAGATWGMACLVDFARALRLSADATFHFSNLGIKELFARVLGDGNGPIAHKLAMVLALVYALGRRAQWERMVLTMTMFSPLVWFHHLVYLAIPLLAVLRSRPLLAWTAVACLQLEREVATRLPALTAIPTLVAATLLFFGLPRDRGTSWPAIEVADAHGAGARRGRDARRRVEVA